jgi:hypothetical protein
MNNLVHNKKLLAIVGAIAGISVIGVAVALTGTFPISYDSGNAVISCNVCAVLGAVAYFSGLTTNSINAIGSITANSFMSNNVFSTVNVNSITANYITAQIGCTGCTGSSYNSVYDNLILNYFPYNNLKAGTGISISGNTITALPSYNSVYAGFVPSISAGTGIAVSPTNAISLLPLTSGSGITISNTNTITATGYNSVYDNLILNYFPYNNLKAGGNVIISGNTITAIAGSGGVQSINGLVGIVNVLTTNPLSATLGTNSLTLSCAGCAIQGNPAYFGTLTTNAITAVGSVTANSFTSSNIFSKVTTNTVVANTLNVSQITYQSPVWQTWSVQSGIAIRNPNNAMVTLFLYAFGPAKGSNTLTWQANALLQPSGPPSFNVLVAVPITGNQIIQIPMPEGSNTLLTWTAGTVIAVNALVLR